MQANKDKEAAAAAAGPSICDRLQSAFHARPAFRPLRRLTVRHQDGGASSKPAAPGPAPSPNHSDPPVPAPPQPLTPEKAPPAPPQPVPVRLPAVAEKKAAASAPPPAGPPVPVPPPDVTAGMAAAATPADANRPSRPRRRPGCAPGSTRTQETRFDLLLDYVAN
ncbi:hypothetical protein HU200_018011 [Digitaria exilis]|uniref:Uncharacterized protein n=1 Tax=Digitaria exilis TaxID=1010633 RepID=A0A835F5A2_9POAL|nr:hypothetical protein HU200_018011 [Digitaria exilis]